jgi:hypothetical protein
MEIVMVFNRINERYQLTILWGLLVASVVLAGNRKENSYELNLKIAIGHTVKVKGNRSRKLQLFSKILENKFARLWITCYLLVYGQQGCHNCPVDGGKSTIACCYSIAA